MVKSWLNLGQILVKSWLNLHLYCAFTKGYPLQNGSIVLQHVCCVHVLCLSVSCVMQCSTELTLMHNSLTSSLAGVTLLVTVLSHAHCDSPIKCQSSGREILAKYPPSGSRPSRRERESEEGGGKRKGREEREGRRGEWQGR